MRFAKKNECEKLHRELWNWLAETCEKYKTEWPGWKKYKTIFGTHCFACEFTTKNKNFGHDCTKCPLDWCKPSQITDLDNYMDDYAQCEFVKISLYHKWKNTDKTYLRKKYAKKIAEMLWNPK